MRKKKTNKKQKGKRRREKIKIKTNLFFSVTKFEIEYFTFTCESIVTRMFYLFAAVRSRK